MTLVLIIAALGMFAFGGFVLYSIGQIVIESYKESVL
jgi:hypothetical protein